jgi:hypothetical protein
LHFYFFDGRPANLHADNHSTICARLMPIVLHMGSLGMAFLWSYFTALFAVEPIFLVSFEAFFNALN